MRALFVGLGSIGTRHLGNLAALCAERGLPLQAWALRSSPRQLPDETAALLAGEFTALPPEQRWEVAFITGPTHLHAEAVAQLRGRVGTFFIEKPVFESTGYDLAALGLGGGQKAYVAAPLRHTALYAAAKARLAGRRVFSARAICSSYLPGWRPGVDYRQNYSAIKAMGGGVALDLIHEWDYLADLFGHPDQVLYAGGKFSDLEIDSDDLAAYIARYPGMLCEVHLDYFGRQAVRGAQFYTREGTIAMDFAAGTLAGPGGGAEDYAEPANAKFQREMAYFVDYALGPPGESINSPARALRVLKTALGECEDGQPEQE